MPYETPEKGDILRHALQKLQKTTPITSIGPGSVARALAEAIANEIGDFYGVLDYKTAMGALSTAHGQALDLIGELFNIERKSLGEVATIDQSMGAFFFFLDAPHVADTEIPAGTRIFTDVENSIGDQFHYVTTENAVIPAGRTRVYVAIRPAFADSTFTAGAGTLTKHNFEHPDEIDVHCTNPKAIAPQVGFETDHNYRQRIMRGVRTSAGGTEEALRFAGLAVTGVRDVKILSTPYGLGSVEALVVPEERSLAVRVVAEVTDILQNKVRPAGIRLFVREPDYAMCSVDAAIILRSGVGVNPDGTARRAEIAILRYLNSLLPGDTLVYTQLVQAILDASDVIKDVDITRFRVRGREILRRNFTPEQDQQVVPGEISVTASSVA